MATILVSCNKGFLDRFPLDSPSSSTFFSNETELVLAINSAYRSFYWISSHNVPYIMWLDGSTDITWTRGNYVNMLDLQGGQVTTETNLFYDTWEFYYNSIMRCNNILENMHRAQEVVSEDFYNRIEAEARFLRAWNYGFLVSFYGDVPLVTTMLQLEDAQIPRTSQEQVLDLIFDDLDFAATHLPLSWDSKDEGRVTKGAAYAYKSRIALYHEKFEVAAQAAQNVMELNQYAVYPNYGQLFKHVGSRSSEVILDIPFLLNVQVHQIPRYLGTRSAPGYSVLVPTQTMVDFYQCTDGKRINQSDLFDPANPYTNRDPRLAQSILRPGEWYNNFLFQTHPDATTTQQNVNGNIVTVNNLEVTNQFATFTGYIWKKYFDEADLPGEVARSQQNFILIRYAEVLLTYAEAKIELNEIDASVIDAINAVRRRPSVLMPAAQITMTQGELRDLIRYERTVELAQEGFRLFDLRRWRIAEHMMPGNVLGRRIKAHWDDRIVPSFNAHGKSIYPNETTVFQIISTNTFNPLRDYLWPIPQRERDVNRQLSQNPHWD